MFSGLVAFPRNNWNQTQFFLPCGLLEEMTITAQHTSLEAWGLRAGLCRTQIHHQGPGWVSEDPIQRSNGQQQHRQHSTSQEAGRTAEDGSQHRQDKGVQGSCWLDGLLWGTCQGRPSADPSPGLRKPLSGEEVLLRHPLSLWEEAEECRGSWDIHVEFLPKWAPFSFTAFKERKENHPGHSGLCMFKELSPYENESWFCIPTLEIWPCRPAWRKEMYKKWEW